MANANHEALFECSAPLSPRVPDSCSGVIPQLFQPVRVFVLRGYPLVHCDILSQTQQKTKQFGGSAES